MSAYRPLTSLAQDAAAELLEPGTRAIDATMGNGHDTLFLARQVAPNGQVIAFDIQAQALQITHQRLVDQGLDGVAELKLRSHDSMLEQVPQDWSGTVSAVMFNLGYLPGGDKALITHAATTLPALDQAMTLLREGGLLSLILYRGHSGAEPESEAVIDWIEHKAERHTITRHETPGPYLYLLKRSPA